MKQLRDTNLFMAALLICEFAAALLLVLAGSFGASISYPIKILAGQTLGLFIPCLIFIRIKRPKLILSFKALDFKNCVYVMAMALLCVPAVQALSFVSSALANNTAADVIEGMFRSSGNIYFSLLVFSLVPAVCEELALRGIIFQGYGSVDIRRSALVNGLFFAFIHLNLQQFLYAFFLGVVFTYIVYYTKSLLSSILAHFMVNAAQLYLSALALNAANTQGLANLFIENTSLMYFFIIFFIIFVVICTVLLYLVFRLFAGYNKNNIKKVYDSGYDYELAIENAAVKLIKVDAVMPRKTKLVSWAFLAVWAVYLLIMLLY